MEDKKQETQKNIQGEQKKQEAKPEKISKEGNGFKKVEKSKVESGNGKKDASNTKKVKSSYIISIVVIIVLILLSIVAVMMYQSNKPEKTLEEMLTALKAGDFNKVQEYINYEEIVEETEMLNNENMNDEAQKLLFDKLEWKVKKVNIQNDKANIELEVTNKDIKAVIGNYMQKALKDLFKGQKVEDTDTEEYILAELKSEDVQMTTNTKNIELIKKDNKWKITANNDLIDAILPGLRETMESLNSSNE